MKLYVGNIASNASEQELNDLFSSYGQVNSVRIIKDKFSGESRGFAFVEMGDSEAGNSAMSNLNGSDFKGQSIRVNEARPQEPRTGGFDRRRSGGDRGGFGSSNGGGNGGSRGGFGGGRDRYNH